MLDIGGVLRCRIYQCDPGFFQIYIPITLLGIEPGETFLANDRLFKSYHSERVSSTWYIKLYADSIRKKNRHKRKYRRVDRITDEVLAKSECYNEVTKIYEDEVTKEDWFTQDIKASILLPIIKERSKIPNSLIYVDDYWKT